jgi:hypothetical protein
VGCSQKDSQKVSGRTRAPVVPISVGPGWGIGRHYWSSQLPSAACLGSTTHRLTGRTQPFTTECYGLRKALILKGPTATSAAPTLLPGATFVDREGAQKGAQSFAQRLELVTQRRALPTGVVLGRPGFGFRPTVGARIGLDFCPTAYFPATSFWNRGFLRSGSKLGSIFSHPGDSQYGIFKSGSSWSSAFSGSPTRRYMRAVVLKIGP